MLHKNRSENEYIGLPEKLSRYCEREEFSSYRLMPNVFKQFPNQPMSMVTIAHLVRVYYICETDIKPPPSWFIRMFVGLPYFKLTNKGWIRNDSR